jgi:hypothetical protein
MVQRFPYFGRIAFLSSVLAAALSGVGPTFADDAQYARMPWHLVDLWWDLGEESPFQSYSIDVTISDDVPSTTNLYIAPIGIAHLSKTPFYGGIQTQADGHTKTSRRIRKIGSGFLMSMWGERSLDAIRPSIGGLCQSSGYDETSVGSFNLLNGVIHVLAVAAPFLLLGRLRRAKVGKSSAPTAQNMEEQSNIGKTRRL